MRNCDRLLPHEHPANLERGDGQSALNSDPPGAPLRANTSDSRTDCLSVLPRTRGLAIVYGPPEPRKRAPFLIQTRRASLLRSFATVEVRRCTYQRPALPRFFINLWSTPPPSGKGYALGGVDRPPGAGSSITDASTSDYDDDNTWCARFNLRRIALAILFVRRRSAIEAILP
jgi:hypothetical protein